MNAMNDLNQSRVEWDCGAEGFGVLVSDSLMFQRGEPTSSDAHLSHVYGLALPLLKRGIPVTPVQLENVGLTGYLDSFRVLLLSYQGMKPLSPDVHAPLANWVKRGGALIVVDDDSDPYNSVREWWNTGENHYRTPRSHLFQQLGMTEKGFRPEAKPERLGKGTVTWLREHPARLAAVAEGDVRVAQAAKAAAESVQVPWRETAHLFLRRGPYLVGAGLDESLPRETETLRGRFVNLFDPELRVRTSVALSPGSRYFLLDLQTQRGNRQPQVLASACKTLPLKEEPDGLRLVVEGVPGTLAVVLLHTSKAPLSISLAGQPVPDHTYSAADQLLWMRFQNTASPRELVLRF